MSPKITIFFAWLARFWLHFPLRRVRVLEIERQLTRGGCVGYGHGYFKGAALERLPEVWRHLIPKIKTHYWHCVVKIRGTKIASVHSYHLVNVARLTQTHLLLAQFHKKKCAHTHKGGKKKTSFTQIVRYENKSSSFVTTNLNSSVCTSVPCVDSLCMWQLFVSVCSLPRLLINVWRWNPLSPTLESSAPLTNVNVWLLELYRKTCLQPQVQRTPNASL